MARLPLAGAGACALLLVLLGACGGAGAGREPTPPAPADPCLSPSQFDACITEQLGRAVSHQVTVDWPAKLDTRGLVPMRLRHSGEVRVVIGPGLTQEAASAVQSGSRGVHTRDQTLARLTS